MEMFILGVVVGIGVSVLAIVSPLFVRQKRPMTKEEWKSGRHAE